MVDSRQGQPRRSEQVNFRLTEANHALLKLLAGLEGARSGAELACRVVEQYLKAQSQSPEVQLLLREAAIRRGERTGEVSRLPSSANPPTPPDGNVEEPGS